MRTSFHHQPEAQHPKSPAIYTPAGRLPHLWVAGSTGRCNTGVKSLRGGFELQGLSWPFIELTRHFVQMGLRVHRQVGSLGKILSQQTVGVLIGSALPRALRITEVDVDIGRETVLADRRSRLSCAPSDRAQRRAVCTEYSIQHGRRE